MKARNKKTSVPYIERDISWMYFNHRILQEAGKGTVPLLERLSFLGIYSNNLDEFYRVRIATLNRIIEYPGKSIKKEKQTAISTFKEINRLNTEYTHEFETTFHQISETLKENNIRLLNENELTSKQADYVKHFYLYQLLGSVTPLYMASFRQFADQPDDNIYLAIRLSYILPKSQKTKKEYAFIGLPVKNYGRFLPLPGTNGKTCLMFLDDVIRYCLPLIFQGTPYQTFEAYTFKFTKDAEIELDTDLRNSILQKIAKGVKNRKNGDPLRLVYDAQMPADMHKHLIRLLNMDRWDTQIAGGRYHNLKDLIRFPINNRPELCFPEQPPLFPADFRNSPSLLETIREKDLFLHYPYHSFSNFLRVLEEAAGNKKVKSIQMTLYRLAKESKVVQILLAASRNGKKVTVVIELLARFDEASNISWSKQMQEAGIRVIFGIETLKVHAKLLAIHSSEGSIVAVSTGNFHEGNAAHYTDITLFTSRPALVEEVRQVFSFIEKPYLPVKFKELLVSPNDMRKKLLAYIHQEIQNAKAGKPAQILAKVNHITDKTLIAKLYEASCAGVKINLLVRGNCSIITGIPHISENIRINGIIDRYLEHSRIFIFENAGQEIYLLGSADWMPRNLDNRIEVLSPVYDPIIRQELKRVITYGLCDTLQGRLVDGSGRNLPWTFPGAQPFRSQTALYEYYKQQNHL